MCTFCNILSFQVLNTNSLLIHLSQKICPFLHIGILPLLGMEKQTGQLSSSCSFFHSSSFSYRSFASFWRKSSFSFCSFVSRCSSICSISHLSCSSFCLISCFSWSDLSSISWWNLSSHSYISCWNLSSHSCIFFWKPIIFFCFDLVNIILGLFALG